MSNLKFIDSNRNDNAFRPAGTSEAPQHGNAASHRLEKVTLSRHEAAPVRDDSHNIDFESKSGVSHMLGAFSFGNDDADLKPSADGWNSVKQGGMGDCYFLSAVVDVAKKDPQAIRDLIKPNQDGSYTVSFHGRDPIKVDGKGLPNGVQADGQWAEILEQAWETQQGNVRDGKVDDWGSSGSADALEALTGQKFGERSGNLLQTELSDDLTNDVIKALKDGKPVTAATGGISSLWQGPKDNVVGEHVYSVIGVDDKGNIQVRNPWGHDKDGQGDGTQWMSPEQFKRDFKNVTLPGDSDVEGAIGRELFNVAREGKHVAQDVG